ncbi:NAD(P)-dependent dehydrogenase, short-chain alcohol dehydrogenase family [Parasphingorhabdus marina DSM 22363]|uniref:NAD(P)-dependent dehydrogenase, short-chain alcohol dehydrogenase family n=1 Tax=Parasphingorhabdus marina DSM 22363 TaxID=1123272 RepID=A0A1N6FT46_9SPHN|nr:SDR family oxidoreductase [Parasphingorhabdus marina]SIN98408.1 NAD(P)-dependent dehydrogenase, short-chain alcohol dehydrogenase family [Parasphingorhabdus marina DSM 22363]
MTARSAVVIGAGGGIGRAMLEILRDEDEYGETVGFSRSENSPVKLDLTSEESIASAAEWIKDKGLQPDLVFVATGLLHNESRGPEKSLRELDGDWLSENYRINAIGPALVAKHFLPTMNRNGPSIFAALSARVGSVSDNRLGGWYGYRAAKAALNMMIRNLAIEWQRKNRRSIIVALHPGTVDTELSEPFQSNVPPGKLFDAERAAGQLLDVLDGLKPADTGRIFAWDGEEITP